MMTKDKITILELKCVYCNSELEIEETEGEEKEFVCPDCGKVNNLVPVPDVTKKDEIRVVEVVNDVSGIKGWLMFFAIGLTIAPIRVFSDLVSLNDIMQKIQPDNNIYNLAVFQLVSGLITGISLIILLIFFYQKKKIAPNLIILFLIIQVVFNLIAFTMVPSSMKELTASIIVQLTSSVLIAAIWITYFIKSKRVKATFIK